MKLTREERKQMLDTLTPLLGCDRSVLDGLSDEDVYTEYVIAMLQGEKIIRSGME